jgi:hypothetical protein
LKQQEKRKWQEKILFSVLIRINVHPRLPSLRPAPR